MALLDVNERDINTILREIAKADLYTDENLQRILSAGADVIAGAVKASVVQKGHSRTGQLQQNIKVDPTLRTHSKSHYRYVTVVVKGNSRRDAKHKKPVRNAVKGFVVNYGRKTNGAFRRSLYWTDAVKKAAPAVFAAMQAEAEKITNERS